MILKKNIKAYIYKNHIFTVGLFYFTLGNIKPKYHSTLKSIYLLAVVKCSMVNEYGFEPVLRPLVNDINNLAVSDTFHILAIYQP